MLEQVLTGYNFLQGLTIDLAWLMQFGRYTEKFATLQWAWQVQKQDDKYRKVSERCHYYLRVI